MDSPTGPHVNYAEEPYGQPTIQNQPTSRPMRHPAPYNLSFTWSFGHDGLAYPQYGLGYNRFGLGYGYNGPLFNRYGYGNALGYSGLLEIMVSTMEFL
ncbi:hypothetical protein CEXT_780191 [Caerostris extrusa]|uniref:Uncharacterized protein n=1 Tax=Caerostris extrusa TaxID=172846 RepID=A0AAV4S6C4_CAEEX|nr:hypothetical protein CEXT_780191 [Caerostris extrusa]